MLLIELLNTASENKRLNYSWQRFENKRRSSVERTTGETAKRKTSLLPNTNRAAKKALPALAKARGKQVHAVEHKQSSLGQQSIPRKLYQGLLGNAQTRRKPPESTTS